MKKIHYVIIILVLIIAFLTYLLITKSNKKQQNVINVLSNQVVLKGDTVFYAIENELPKPIIIYRDKIIEKIIPWDSTEILRLLRNYYAVRFYNDTVRGQDVIVSINDSITENELFCRDVYIQNTRDKVTNNIIQNCNYKDLKGFYLGGGLGHSIDNKFKPSAQAEIMYLFKNGSAISGGVLWTNHNEPIYSIGAKIKMSEVFR